MSGEHQVNLNLSLTLVDVKLVPHFFLEAPFTFALLEQSLKTSEAGVETPAVPLTILKLVEG